MKYLVLLVVLVVVIAWLRAGRRKPPEVPPPPRSGPGLPQSMVRCAHCGLHLPQRDAIATAGQFYCSPEHQRAG